MVNMDAESGNLVEMMVFDWNTVAHAHNSHPVNHLYKHEYNHGTYNHGNRVKTSNVKLADESPDLYCSW